MVEESAALTLSADQERALDAVADWYASVPSLKIPQFCDDPGCEGQDGGLGPDGEREGRPHTHGFAHGHPVMSVGGLAGTGKTTIARLLGERLNARVSFATPTHKAASVLRRKLSEDERVSTYHSLVYYPQPSAYCTRSGRGVQVDVSHRCIEGNAGVECGCQDRFERCGGCVGPCRVEERVSFERRELLSGMHHLIAVDEASMLTSAQVEDVRSFGVPVLLIGDHGQLPPVKAEMNPWIREPRVVLERNHRQGEGSGIIDVAHAVRRGWRPTVGRYGDGSTAVIDRRESGDAVISLLQRFEAGPRRAVVVWRNKTRCLLNGLLRGRDGLPAVGDRVVCLRGDPMPQVRPPTGVGGSGSWTSEHRLTYVHNGELGTVAATVSTGDDGRVATLVVKLDDPDPELGITRPFVRTHTAVAQFGEPAGLALNDPRRPRGREWHSWDWGYALTAHKAQGSEWDEVVVVDERAMDYERWTYTAVTRAKKRLVVVRW